MEPEPLFPPIAASWRKLANEDYRNGFALHIRFEVSAARDLIRQIWRAGVDPRLQKELEEIELFLVKWYAFAESRDGIPYLEEVAPLLIIHIREMAKRGVCIKAFKRRKEGRRKTPHTHAVIAGRIQIEIAAGAGTVETAIERAFLNARAAGTPFRCTEGQAKAIFYQATELERKANAELLRPAPDTANDRQDTHE